MSAQVRGGGCDLCFAFQTGESKTIMCFVASQQKKQSLCRADLIIRISGKREEGVKIGDNKRRGAEAEHERAKSIHKTDCRWEFVWQNFNNKQWRNKMSGGVRYEQAKDTENASWRGGKITAAKYNEALCNPHRKTVTAGQSGLLLQTQSARKAGSVSTNTINPLSWMTYESKPEHAEVCGTKTEEVIRYNPAFVKKLQLGRKW